MPEQDVPVTITSETRASLRLVIGISSAIIVGASGVTGMSLWMNDISHTLKAIQNDLGRVVVVQNGHVERAEFRAWAREFAALNPDLQVPMPD